MKKSIATILFFNIISVVFNASAAIEASGNCAKEILKQSKKHIGPNTREFKFQGFGDINSTGVENQFTLSYSFNDECQGGVEVEISPLKSIQKENAKGPAYSEATECSVIKITDDAADCG